MYRTLLFSIALICASCAVQTEHGREEEKLLQTDREFAQASLDLGSAEAFYNFLADSSIMFPAGDHPVYTRAGIYQRMKTNEGAGILSWQPQKAEVAAAGDMGWTWGKYIYEYETI